MMVSIGEKESGAVQVEDDVSSLTDGGTLDQCCSGPRWRREWKAGAPQRRGEAVHWARGIRGSLNV